MNLMGHVKSTDGTAVAAEPTPVVAALPPLALAEFSALVPSAFSAILIEESA